MTEITNAISVRNGQIELEGLTFPFTEFDGVELSREEEKYPVGKAGGAKRSLVSGTTTVENFTLKKPAQPEDKQLFDWIQDPCAPTKTLTVTWVDGCDDRTVMTLILYECQIMKWSGPEVDQNKGDVAITEIELSANSVEWR